jgi:hypothetical protein
MSHPSPDYLFCSVFIEKQSLENDRSLELDVSANGCGLSNVGLAAKFGRGIGKFADRVFVYLEAACQPGRLTETRPPVEASSCIAMSLTSRTPPQTACTLV